MEFLLILLPIAYAIGLWQGYVLAKKKYGPTFNDYGKGKGA